MRGAITWRDMEAGAPAPGRVTHVKRGQRQDKFGPFPSQRLSRFAWDTPIYKKLSHRNIDDKPKPTRPGNKNRKEPISMEECCAVEGLTSSISMF